MPHHEASAPSAGDVDESVTSRASVRGVRSGALIAVSVIAFGLIRWPDPMPADASSPAVDLVAPRGGVDAFERFQWSTRGALRECSYTVKVYSVGDDGPLSHVEPRLRTTSWAPDRELANEWPERIRWSVDVIDPQGEVLATKSAFARRATAR